MLLSMYQAGKVNLDDMMTREYRLEQINDGYRDMLKGRNIRGIIRYTDADRWPFSPRDFLRRADVKIRPVLRFCGH
jgi:hypothetical protein